MIQNFKEYWIKTTKQKWSVFFLILIIVSGTYFSIEKYNRESRGIVSKAVVIKNNQSGYIKLLHVVDGKEYIKECEVNDRPNLGEYYQIIYDSLDPENFEIIK